MGQRDSGLPLAAAEIDSRAVRAGIALLTGFGERHAFAFKESALPVWSAECESGSERAIPEHDPMTGNHSGFGIGVQRIADHARIAWSAGERGDLPVCGDATRGNPSDDVIHLSIKRLAHATIIRPIPADSPRCAESWALRPALCENRRYESET